MDEFDQEHWDSACDNMPQEYLENLMAQINAIQPGRKYLPMTDADLDGSDKLKAMEARINGRKRPRWGQPDEDAPLVEWYHEYRYRFIDHPLWFEQEYYYTDDGEEIHFRPTQVKSAAS